MKLEEAIQTVCEHLQKDTSYRAGWHANIAMAFKDQANWDARNWDRQELHDTANKAAEHFLKLLCRDYEDLK